MEHGVEAATLDDLALHRFLDFTCRNDPGLILQKLLTQPGQPGGSFSLQAGSFGSGFLPDNPCLFLGFTAQGSEQFLGPHVDSVTC